MVGIIVAARVEDAKKWEQSFRTHRDLFKSMTATTIRYAIADDNQVAVYGEATDKDKWFQVMESQSTADAMQEDGVKRETVKVFVLDKTLDL